MGLGLAMSAKFAHSERQLKSNVRCQRDDLTQAGSHHANMADEATNHFLKEWRNAKGLSLDELAAETESSKGYLSDLERGKRKPTLKMIERLAEGLKISPQDLMARDPAGASRQVPLVGYVGAGAEAHYYASADEGLGEVEAPENASASTVAAEIRGASLGPAFDRWLVYYDDVRSPVTPDLHGQLCVVGLDTDQVLVKILRPAGEPDHFHLISNGGEEPIFDRRVLWAARVKNMRPR